jgi:hypothetical protein
MIIFRRPRESGEASSWIRKDLVIVAERFVYDTKTVAANTHSGEVREIATKEVVRGVGY